MAKKPQEPTAQVEQEAAKDVQEPHAPAPSALEASADEVLKKRIVELEAKLAEKDDESLKRVCKASGVAYEDVVEHERKKIAPHEALIAIDMGQHEVNINGNIFRGKIEVPASVAEVINQAIGNKRMRHLRELVGNDYLVEGLTSGGFSSKVIGQVNEYGEKIG